MDFSSVFNAKSARVPRLLTRHRSLKVDDEPVLEEPPRALASTMDQTEKNDQKEDFGSVVDKLYYRFSTRGMQRQTKSTVFAQLPEKSI